MEKKCIAMLLAGGQGSRLGALTKNIAKPAVSFGGKYKMIDFSLSNCANSQIDTVGVLTQYRPFQLNAYIANGSAWDFSSLDGGIYMLPPYETQTGGKWYRGTADAIYRNLDFIRLYKPKYVLILSGDHLYRMDYRKMLESHIATNADATISTIQVSWEEASRFGIITADENRKVVKFTEKPKEPDSNLASMGIYIFNTELLMEKLIEDAKVEDSEHDFGKNIIPNMLAEGRYLNCYEFEGFWKDVGTIPAYYETSLALLDSEPEFDLYSEDFPLMSNSNIYPTQYIGEDAEIKDSMINNGCTILGKVVHSLIGNNCTIEEGAVVEESVILPGAKICKNAHVVKAILGEDAVVEEGVTFGDADGEIAVLGNADHATL